MNFLKWLSENGSINQSMPELDREELPSGSMISSDPYSSKDDYPPTSKISGKLLIRKPNKTRNYWVVEKNNFIGNKKLEVIRFKSKDDLKSYLDKIKDYSIEFYK